MPQRGSSDDPSNARGREARPHRAACAGGPRRRLGPGERRARRGAVPVPPRSQTGEPERIAGPGGRPDPRLARPLRRGRGGGRRPWGRHGSGDGGLRRDSGPGAPGRPRSDGRPGRRGQRRVPVPVRLAPGFGPRRRRQGEVPRHRGGLGLAAPPSARGGIGGAPTAFHTLTLHSVHCFRGQVER